MELSNEKATANDWELENKICGLISAGILGGVTGKGAELLIIDAPVKNMAEALSEIYRNKVWNEWEATFSTRLHPGANVIVIMTIWHHDDLANRLIKKGGSQLSYRAKRKIMICLVALLGNHYGQSEDMISNGLKIKELK